MYLKLYAIKFYHIAGGDMSYFASKLLHADLKVAVGTITAPEKDILNPNKKKHKKTAGVIFHISGKLDIDIENAIKDKNRKLFLLEKIFEHYQSEYQNTEVLEKIFNSINEKTENETDKEILSFHMFEVLGERIVKGNLKLSDIENILKTCLKNITYGGKKTALHRYFENHSLLKMFIEKNTTGVIWD